VRAGASHSPFPLRISLGLLDDESLKEFSAEWLRSQI
jgi:hypothetical protein